MKKDWLYIFLHIPKSAGTTLNKHIEKNFRKGEAILLDDNKLEVDTFTTTSSGYINATKKYFSKFTKKEKKKIKIITGHHIYYGLHKIFDRPARYFTFVRDPNERTLSFYNYYRTLYENEKGSGRDKRFYKYNLLKNNKVLTLHEWIRHNYGIKKTYSIPKTMYKYLERLGYLEKGKSMNEKVELGLKKFYFIGLTETFAEDSLFLYQHLGINKYFISQNVSKQFKKYISPQAKKILNAKNSPDYVLYRKAIKLNSKFKIENPDLFSNLDAIKTKKRILTPFTQVIFDFGETLHLTSSYLRNKSGLYSAFMDNVKGKKL